MKNKKLIMVLSVFLIIIIGLVWLVFDVSGRKFFYGSVEPVGAPTPEEAIAYAAKAIEDGNIEDALKMFSGGAHNKMKDLLSQLDSKGKERLAESLKNAKLDNEAEAPVIDNFRTYKTERLVDGLPEGSSVTVHFHMITLPGGNWVIMNL